MKSTTLARLDEQRIALLDEVKKKADAAGALTLPDAEIIANEVQADALLGDLQLLDSLVGKLGAVGPGGSGFKAAIDAALAKAGGNAPQPEANNVLAALAVFEGAGAWQLDALLQAVRNLTARFGQ